MSDKLTQIRAQLPAVKHCAFLNTGTCGPLPPTAADAVARVTQAEYTEGRASTKRFVQMREDGAAVRELFGELFNVAPETIAMTSHTTEGMNAVTYGFNWEPGDEIVTTTLEHEAGLYPMYMVAERFGVVVKYVDIGLGADPLPALEAALTDKTRLISLSHVPYSSGACLPLKEIVQMAHAHGVAVLADGAQTAGAMPLDLADIGVDFYAVPGQKWLCGPESTGALYIHPDWFDKLQPTYMGFTAITHQDYRGEFELAPGALRFESGTKYPAAIAGLRASLEWLRDEAGWDWIFDRIQSLTAYTRPKIEALDGVRMLTPANRQSSLINFLPVGWSAARMAGLVDTLTAQGTIIRSIPHEPFGIRVSCGFYNTEAEIDTLCERLTDLLAAGPQAIAIPEWTKIYGMSDEPVL